MGANDLVMQRLSDTLAQIHTEMVQVRQQRQRALADAFETVAEEDANIGIGGTCSPNPLMSAPILVKRFFVYTSTANSVFRFFPGGYGIPLLAGISTFVVETLYGPNVRPSVTDPSTTADLYIRISGHALPSAADTL